MTYIRSTDGAPAVRLSSGSPASLSPDGRWVAVEDRTATQVVLTFVPTGVGGNMTIPVPGFDSAGLAFLLPDLRQVLFMGSEKGKDSRLYLIDRAGGPAKGVSPEGINVALGLKPLAPDGKSAIALTPDSGLNFAIYPFDGGPSRPVPGLRPSEVVIRWTADSRGVYAFNRDILPAQVVRIDLATGTREPWITFMPPDRAGINGIHSIVITPDGSAAAYNYHRKLSELYLIEGLK